MPEIVLSIYIHHLIPLPPLKSRFPHYPLYTDKDTETWDSK